MRYHHRRKWTTSRYRRGYYLVGSSSCRLLWPMWPMWRSADEAPRPREACPPMARWSDVRSRDLPAVTAAIRVEGEHLDQSGRRAPRSEWDRRGAWLRWAVSRASHRPHFLRLTPKHNRYDA